MQFNPKAYWEARLSSRFDLKGVGDIGLSLSYNEYLYKVRANVFRRILRYLKVQPKTLEVLDVGSGTGFYVRQWLDFGASLTGSDLTQRSAGALRQQYPSAAFIEWDIGGSVPPELGGRSFDVVTAFDVLFHLVSDASYSSAISNFARLLRPGGYLVFSDNLSNKTIRHGSHQVSRREAEVSSFLRGHGFRKVAVFPMFVLMNDPVRTNRRVLRKLFSYTSAVAARGEKQGRVIGAILFPLELLLTKLLPRGPSTEIFIWQR